MTPKLTNGGENLILRAMDGETITFTKIALGNGDCPANYKAMTALANQQVLLGLDTYSLEDEGYIKLKAILQNNQLDASFIWTEVGIYAEDPDEGADILYAYGHYQLEADEGQNAPSLVPKAASSVMEMEIEYDIFVGEAENVSAALAESAVYTTQEQFQQHTGAQNNPHAVTKAQVGLGNVPNVSTNDQTPTWSISGTLVSLVSGETLSVAFGKLAKAVSSLISHIADTTKHITAAERTAWNGKAAGSHNHSAANITSGTLSVARGGTGVGSLQELKNAMGLNIEKKYFNAGNVQLNASETGHYFEFTSNEPNPGHCTIVYSNASSFGVYIESIYFNGNKICGSLTNVNNYTVTTGIFCEYFYIH